MLETKKANVPPSLGSQSNKIFILGLPVTAINTRGKLQKKPAIFPRKQCLVEIKVDFAGHQNTYLWP